ncbi:relaxase/mobilization nuclease domain-containing protein [Pedobacter gandavensis]|uniref:relaxase/mobilization nuclease domain-containing protein n=1 Tax=Pedobacter gandavensis TaxID=2679963 RepID=UPI00292ED4A6|nr:relaxase/mobilization nuclease domain-containing protein [Pedobacter gandavensis]
MVAKIVIGKSIRGILHYNENKVSEGEAKLILASGFAGEIEKMSFDNKLKRFQHLTELKPSVKTNALHISLNFDSSENIGSAKMQMIAIAYMERIGFGDQPYIVYRHNDAGHQHLHIATTSIQRGGECIDLHNIGRLQSEPARKAIEIEFDLVKAESKVFKQEPGIRPADLEQIKYGKQSTKRQISNVLSGVINSYMFTSVTELNAILRQFNVTADRGQEDSEMFKKKGLIYSMLDKNGDKVGVPIKASAFYAKPTMSNLEQKFEKNKEKRKPYKSDLIARIDKVLLKYQTFTRTTLISELQKQGINLAIRENNEGRIYGITFVDHQNKVVFKGSDLDKRYSANAISKVIGSEDKLRAFLKPSNASRAYLNTNTDVHVKTYLEPVASTNLLDDLLGKSLPEYMPNIKRKRKKRRRGLTL